MKKTNRYTEIGKGFFVTLFFLSGIHQENVLICLRGKECVSAYIHILRYIAKQENTVSGEENAYVYRRMYEANGIIRNPINGDYVVTTNSRRSTQS